jgi:hypothetical protein
MNNIGSNFNNIETVRQTSYQSLFADENSSGLNRNIGESNETDFNAVLDFLSKIISETTKDSTSETNPLDSLDEKSRQAVAEKQTGLENRRAKGEKGDLFETVKINNEEKILILRENGKTELRSPADYNVKTTKEALNVEKGIKETQEKVGKLAERRANGESGTLYETVTVNGKDSVIALPKNQDNVKILNADTCKNLKPGDNAAAIIKADKLAESVQDGVASLKARREAGETGTLYATAKVEGTTQEKSGFLGIKFSEKEPDTNILLKLKEDGSVGAADYGQYSAANESQAIKVDQAVDRLREQQAANPGKAVSEEVLTGGTVRSGGFLGLFTGNDPEKITVKLDEKGNLGTDKNKDVPGFLEQVWGGLKSVAGIAGWLIPGLQPLALAVNIGSAVESIAKGNWLGGLTGLLGSAGSAIGGAVGNALQTASKFGQNIYNIANGGDVLSNILDSVGSVSQGAFKGLVDKASSAYNGIKSALTGGNIFDSVKSGLGAISDFSQGAFKKTVDGIGNIAGKLSNVFGDEGSIFDRLDAAFGLAKTVSNDKTVNTISDQYDYLRNLFSNEK